MISSIFIRMAEKGWAVFFFSQEAITIEGNSMIVGVGKSRDGRERKARRAREGCRSRERNQSPA